MYRESIRKLSPRCGRDRFFEMLRTHDLLVERKRSYTRTTNPYHRFRVHRNLIKDSQPERPNQVWVSDITYIQTGDRNHPSFGQGNPVLQPSAHEAIDPQGDVDKHDGRESLLRKRDGRTGERDTQGRVPVGE
jgi:transposase InsO family protein